jgi:tetratricopeptide (TPR) repeat protein
MFGNLKGWIISGLIAALVVVIFVSSGILQVPPVSKPSGIIKFSEKIVLPVDPKPFLPNPKQNRDAAEVYRLAINEYENNEKLYAPGEAYSRTPAAMVDANPKGIQYILDAADCKTFDLFSSRPDEVVHYNATWPDLTALERMGMHTIVAGATYRNRKDLDTAEKYLKAAFLLGYRLYNERVVWQEMNSGMNLMINASSQLAKVYQEKGQADQARACADFQKELDQYKKDKIVKPIVSALNSITTSTVGERGGDFFYLARESPERVWRVEALLALGRMKYNTSNRGDQVAAKREVKRYLNDPDPAVALAAKLADELTIERYRMLGG